MLLLKTSLISSTISNQYFYEASTKVLQKTIKIDRFLEDFDTRKRAGNRGNTSRAEIGMVLSINYTTKLHSLKFSGQTERAHQIHVQKSCCRGAYNWCYGIIDYTRLPAGLEHCSSDLGSDNCGTRWRSVIMVESIRRLFCLEGKCYSVNTLQPG